MLSLVVVYSEGLLMLVNLYNINCILILSFLFLHKSSSFVKLFKPITEAIFQLFLPHIS